MVEKEYDTPFAYNAFDLKVQPHTPSHLKCELEILIKINWLCKIGFRCTFWHLDGTRIHFFLTLYHHLPSLFGEKRRDGTTVPTPEEQNHFMLQYFNGFLFQEHVLLPSCAFNNVFISCSCLAILIHEICNSFSDSMGFGDQGIQLNEPVIGSDKFIVVRICRAGSLRVFETQNSHKYHCKSIIEY